MAFDVLVIGGGINGLATLFHLLRLGARRLALIEQFKIGHSRGSSGGATRIIRSIYANADYVRLIAWVRQQEWPALERELGRSLVRSWPGCFFGPRSEALDGYAQAVSAVGANVEPLEFREARRRFPQLNFRSTDTILADHTAGVVASAETIDALERYCRARGVHVLESVQVRTLDGSRTPVRVDTTQGPIEAEAVVVTAGPWIGTLLPQFRAIMREVEQAVGYVVVESNERVLAQTLPIWARMGDSPEEIAYGLPSCGSDGAKIAFHKLDGPEVDIEREPKASLEAVRELELLMASALTLRTARLERVDTCLYTCTRSEGFAVGALPDAGQVIVGSACSGHAFKFGPLTGRILAELAMRTPSANPEIARAWNRVAVAIPGNGETPQEAAE